MQHAEPKTKNDSLTSPWLSKWSVAGIGALVIGILAGWLIVWIIDASYQYHGTVIQSPDPANDFALTGAGEQTVSLSDFRGQAVLLYFGYTFCPDVCPATMVELAKANQLLGMDADRLQVIMVSLDPLRDTPQKLDQYVKHFDQGFIGLTGTDDEVAAAAIPLGIFYEMQQGSIASGYLIDHTASVIVIDPEGHLKILYPFGTPGEDIAEDIRHLVR